MSINIIGTHECSPKLAQAAKQLHKAKRCHLPEKGMSAGTFNAAT
jgi:hypothetical protein